MSSTLVYRSRALRIGIPVVHPATGRGIELWIRLTHDPSPDVTCLDELIAGSLLRLPIELGTEDDTSAPDRAAYFRTVRFALRTGNTTLTTRNARGERPGTILLASLDRATTFDAVRALSRRASPLAVEAHIPPVDARARPSTVSAPLTDLIGDLEGDLETWGRLLAPDPETGALRRVPNRSEGRSTRAVFDVRDVARLDRGFATVSAVAAVTRLHDAPAHTFAVHPSAIAASVHHSGVSDLVFAPMPHRPQLPRLDDQAAEVWPDASDPSTYWYLPSFRIVDPDPAQPASVSPFTFRFAESGHDVEGRPGLDATITFALQQQIGDTVARRLNELGNPQARPVALQNLAVSLLIPFRDGRGQTRSEIFTAAVSASGDRISATVALLNNWVRLAYGALAVGGFQSEPPCLQIAGHFDAMVPVPAGTLAIALENKTEILPAPHIRPDRERDVSFPTAIGAIAFARPAGREARSTRPLAGAQLVAVHGQLHSQALTRIQRDEPLYARRAMTRTREVPCLFPCDRLGALYIEQTEDGDVAVGCRDALKLGETQYRLYAPVEDARLPRHLQVFRSLLQPGRFLILPAAYKVVRFGADAGDRAYRPAIFLYSSLDAQTPANNRAVLMATLGPDVAAHEIEYVREVLRELSPSPVLQFITEIHGSVSYSWALAGGDLVKDQQAIRRWDSFQVSMAVDLSQAPLLETILKTNGMTVVATFELPDGTRLQTNLALDLTAIVGPIGGTAAHVERAAGGVTLTNRIDVDLDVDDLLAIDDHAEPGQPSITTMPVQKTLAPAAAITMAADIAGAARLVPVATPKQSGATLEEIRSFVEDIFVQMAFINLVAFSSHGVSEIAIDARLKATTDSKRATLREGDSVQLIDIVLPLTRYVAHPVIEFQASVARAGGLVETTPWIDWPLESKGNVVGVSWELLGLAN